MAISETRKRQFIAFSVVVYGLTFYSVYDAVRTSVSFLQTIIKLRQGFNVIILTVFAILNSVLLWKLSTSLLLGDLRLIEYEHIFERLPFTIINTMLMSSMFNEHDFFTVAVLGLLLLYMKVFHWILRDRLEALLQTIQDSTTLRDLILTRFIFNLLLLAVADYNIISHCVTNSLANSFGASASVHLMMGMEFAMLLIDLANISLHTLLNFYEFYKSHSHGTQRRRNIVDDGDGEMDDNQFMGLEGKFIYERIIDIATRFLKTVLHALLLIPFKMPMMLIKDVLWDFLTLQQNAKTLWKTWRNNKQLDYKLPTVTQEQMGDVDNMCIICMDELFTGQDGSSHRNKPKKLPCGHVLHLCCLKNWMERSQTCPICRLAVFDENGNVAQSTSSPSPTTTETEGQPSGTSGEPAAFTMQASDAETQEPGASAVQHGNEDTDGNPNRGTRNTWYTFPIEESSNDSVCFTMKSANGDQLIPARLRFEKKTDIESSNNGLNDDNDSNEVEVIVIPDDAISDQQNIEGLKRRISELESQVEDLTKRVRKD
ncbi:hypothetical protein HG536_0H04350 [Torulaspora globosa]|uniref:RING-type E3 ubiquitin transferase n=1 Tax=Torulaspora globosa TaxID=48254 RepID=A0A7G3ZNH3_9SACH|nr:uncharacterized protein HG536_0H04350 [Torulaspora globosa]QLL35059.1 hypothetical protein HG536_0H04350 [Torulaspora globosa]